MRQGSVRAQPDSGRWAAKSQMQTGDLYCTETRSSILYHSRMQRSSMVGKIILTVEATWPVKLDRFFW